MTTDPSFTTSSRASRAFARRRTPSRSEGVSPNVVHRATRLLIPSPSSLSEDRSAASCGYTTGYRGRRKMEQFAEKKAKLFGNHVLLVTPLTPTGGIDVESTKSLIDYVADKGVHGILALGSTGEVF